MFTIYTPKAWRSIFGYPSLYIEDNGLIFSEKDYHKNSRNPVGKIDYASGLVYGEDYHRVSKQPIGKVDRRNDGVTQIYGPDYYRLSARPILYIRENRIYDAEDFYKLFPQEKGFIEETPPKPPVTPPQPPVKAKKREQKDDHKGRKILFAVFIVVFMVAATIWVFTDVDYALPTVIMSVVGMVLALIFSKSYPGCAATICCTYGVLMFIYDYISTTSHKTIGAGEMIFSIVLYPILAGLTFLIPSLALGGLVWLVQRPFLEKKEEKKEETETK